LSDDKIKIRDSLVEELKDFRVIPFVGAGVSRAVEKTDKDAAKTFNPLFPSWKEFLISAAMTLRGEKNYPAAKDIISLLKLSRPKYLEAAQIAFDSLGIPDWNKLLKKTFEIDEDKADLESLELAQLVWQLGSDLVFTTNIDEVLEWRAVKDEKIIALDTQIDEFPELLREEIIKPTLIYLHGRIRDKANIVFTLKQYEDFYERQKNTAKLKTLHSFLGQKTFLFVGFSLDDPYFVEQLEYIHKTYHGASDFFYVLVRKEERGKLNHLPYVKEVDYENFGEPLLKVMRRMRDIVSEAKRVKTVPPEPKIPEVVKDKSFFNVPYDSKGKEFVGRTGNTEEIWSLLNQKTHSAVGQNISIKGLGGWGKTQLVVEYAYEYQDKYKNGVFWLVADENIDNQLLQIAEKQEWINKSDKTINQSDVAKAKFLALSEALIIFDNVDSYEDIKDYLPKPDLHNHILITSRYKITEFRQFNLELLNPSESQELLLKISKRATPTESDSQPLKELLETLGGIPLAIELVGGYLAEYETVTFAKYNQFLDEYPLPRLEEVFPDDSFTNHDRSIILTLRISEKLIKEKPLMVEILNVLAWSGNSSMGISLLQSLVEPKDELELQNAIGDAHKLRLLKKDADAERYAIHRLLARVIRHENPLEKNKEWHQKIVNNLESWFDKWRRDFEYLAEFEAEIEHLREWQNQTFKFLPKQSVWLFALEGFPLIHRGNYQTSLYYLEKAFNLYINQNLSDRKLLADINSELGFIQNELGDYEQGLMYSLRAFKVRQELFGEKHSSTAMCLNNIGTAYGKLGNHSEALKYFFQSFEINKELFGEKHPDVATCLNNIGSIYIQLGNHNEALKYLLQSFEISKKLFGEKHPNVVGCLLNISRAYSDLGNYGEALKCSFQSFEIIKELFDEKHPDMAMCLNNIGSAYSKLGNHNEALKYLLQSFEISKELLGEKHPNTIVFASNLVNAYLSLGKIDDAGKLAARFLSNVPNKHPQRQFFEKFGRAYAKVVGKKKKRPKK
jgi:tetratricopeptide (TPR) repeat protein